MFTLHGMIIGLCVVNGLTNLLLRHSSVPQRPSGYGVVTVTGSNIGLGDIHAWTETG